MKQLSGYEPVSYTHLYNTNAEARTLAKYFIMITAFFMPQNAFLHATYFTLRSGGKTIVTFLFDSVFIWVVSVTIAFTLSRFTGLPVDVYKRQVGNRVEPEDFR